MSSWKCIKRLWNHTREAIKDIPNQILDLSCCETFCKLQAGIAVVVVFLNELWLGGGTYFMIEQQPHPPILMDSIVGQSWPWFWNRSHSSCSLVGSVAAKGGWGASLIPCVVSGSGTLSSAADLSCENLRLPPAARPSHLHSSNSSQAVTLHGRGASTHTTLCFKGTALNFWLDLDGRERDNTCFFPRVGLRWLLPQAGWQGLIHDPVRG